MAVKVGSFAKATGGAPASQAVTGVGFKPRALILWTAGTLADGAFEAGVQSGIGFSGRSAANAITSGSVGWSDEDNVGTTNSSGANSDSALKIANPSGTTIYECTCASMDDDGFTLSWTTNNASAVIINYLAIGGSDVTDAAVVNWSVATSTGNQAVTGVGFQPDIVFHSGWGPTTELNFGAMNAAGEQYACSVEQVDGLSSSRGRRHYHSGSCIYTIDSSGTVDGINVYVSMDADGFTTNVSNAHGFAYAQRSLCIRGGDWKIGAFTASGAGNTVSGLSFAPEGVLMVAPSVNSAIAASSDACFSVGAYDGTTHRCGIVVDEYISDPINCAAMSSGTYLVLQDTDGNQTLGGQGACTLTGDGFSIAWAGSAAEAVSMPYIAFAAGAAAGGGSGLLMQQHHHTVGGSLI